MRPNAAMLGGLAALTGVISLQSVEHAIQTRFSGRVAAGNIAAARACHEHVLADRKVAAGA
jgi:pyruvate ferredoxin oxidoreductase gamma subunit